MRTNTNHNGSINRVVKETIMRKRSTWKGALMGLAALVAVTGWTSAARASQCGDLNNDSKVTIADALLLLQAQNGVPGTYCGGLRSNKKVEVLTLGFDKHGNLDRHKSHLGVLR